MGSLNYRILQYVRDVCAVVVRTAAGIFNCGGGGGSKWKGGSTVVGVKGKEGRTPVGVEPLCHTSFASMAFGGSKTPVGVNGGGGI